MKVLYLHQYFTLPTQAGGTRSYEMAQQLIAHGHQVTMVCGLEGNAKIDHKNGWQKPKTSLLLSPCVDLSHTKEAEMRALEERDTMLQLDRIVTLNAIWQGQLDARHPWVSPVFGDLTCLDNIHVYFGSDEILKPDTLFLQAEMEKAGKTGHFHEFEGMFHTFAMFPIPEGFRAVKMMAKDIRGL